MRSQHPIDELAALDKILELEAQLKMLRMVVTDHEMTRSELACKAIRAGVCPALLNEVNDNIGVIKYA